MQSALTDTPERVKALDRLGEEIADLSAHLQAGIARLLDLIREFDARGGWNNGAASSCAHWLTWRTGLDSEAAREHVRVARAPWAGSRSWRRRWRGARFRMPRSGP